MRPLPRRPRRRRHPRRAARRGPLPPPCRLSFAVRNANKRGVTIDLEAERERLLSLLESADVWIETTRPGTLAALGLGPDDVLARNPRARDHVDHRLRPDRRLPRLAGRRRDPRGDERHPQPLRAGRARPASRAPRDGDETAAIQAAWATLVAYWNRLETGRGDHVDFSILEAATQTMDPAYGTASVSRASAFPSTRGRPEAGLYPIFPCADGHVRVVVLAPRQWRAMRAWLGEPAAFQDERFDAIPARLEASAELHELYAALFAGMTKDAIAAEGQARGVPVAPVLEVAEVLASPHFEARGAFVDAEVAPGVHGRLPSGFCEIDGARVGFRHRAPEPGEHDDDLAGAPCERPAGRRRDRRGGRRAEPAARRAARRRLRDHRHRQRDRAPARRPGRRRDQDREPRLPRRGARGLRREALAQLRRRQPQQAQLRREPAHAGGRRPAQAARRRGRRRARELQAGDAREARARLRGAARRQARPRDAEHQRARLDRAVEPLARLRPDRALRLGDREPLALPRRRARVRRADHDLPGPLRRARVRHDGAGGAHPPPPDGGRRVHRERAGRDDRQPARRRLPRRLARRRARRRALGRLSVCRRRRVVRHHGRRRRAAAGACAASRRRADRELSTATWPSGRARFRRAR